MIIVNNMVLFHESLDIKFYLQMLILHSGRARFELKMSYISGWGLNIKGEYKHFGQERKVKTFRTI